MLTNCEQITHNGKKTTYNNNNYDTLYGVLRQDTGFSNLSDQGFYFLINQYEMLGLIVVFIRRGLRGNSKNRNATRNLTLRIQ